MTYLNFGDKRNMSVKIREKQLRQSYEHFLTFFFFLFFFSFKAQVKSFSFIIFNKENKCEIRCGVFNPLQLYLFQLCLNWLSLKTAVNGRKVAKIQILNFNKWLSFILAYVCVFFLFHFFLFDYRVWLFSFLKLFIYLFYCF